MPLADIEKIQFLQGASSTLDDLSHQYDKEKDDEYVVIDFETDQVWIGGEINPPVYEEDGFVITATQYDIFQPGSGLLSLIDKDNVDYVNLYPEVNVAIAAVNQDPGRVVALANYSVDDLVIQRSDEDKFEFEGGYFSFASTYGDIPYELVTLTFNGYKDGKLIDSFEATINEQGGFIKSELDKKIDTLMISDGQPTGWVFVDNLMFST